MDSYFQMGGYAEFVWPAYGLAAVILAGILTSTLHSLRSRERELKALQELMPSRRGRSRDGERAGNP